MSLKKRKPKGGSKAGKKKSMPKKSSGKKEKLFELRYAHQGREDGKLGEFAHYHKVRAMSLQEAKEKMSGGTVHSTLGIISKDEDKKGITPANRRRYESLGTNIEPKILQDLEKQVKSKVEDVSKYGYDHWRIETDDGDAYHVFGSMSALEQTASDYLVNEDFPENLQHYPDWLLEGNINEDYFFREWESDERESIRDMVENNHEQYGLTYDEAHGYGGYDKVEEVIERELENWKDRIKSDGVAEYLRELGMEDKIKDYVNERDVADDIINSDGAAHVLGYSDEVELFLPYDSIAYKEDW